jgi:succinoglycan biosynthesis transport protein ExoP
MNFLDVVPQAQTPVQRLEADYQPFAATEAAESPLTGYLLIFLRRRYLILGFIVAGLLAALLITFTTVKLYRATTVVEIAREASRVVDQKGVEPMDTGRAIEFYQTQYGLIRSRALAEAVVRDLRLSQNPTFLYGYGRSQPKAGVASPPRAALDRTAANIVQGNLLVNPVRGSGLVEVSFSSPDPSLSAKIANAIADKNIRTNLTRQFDATAYARHFLEQQLELTRAKLEDSERRLVAYANQQNIITLDSGQASSDGSPQSPKSLPSVDLEALNASLMQARADRIAAQAHTQGSRNGSAALTDPTLSALRQSRADLGGQLAKLLAQFKPDYPPVQALQHQINEIDNQIAARTNQISGSVSSEYRSALAREQALQAQVNTLKGSVLNFRERSIQYNILQREADTNRQQYQALLQRYKEIGVAGNVGANNISVVDAAETPTSPFTPRMTLNLLLGGIMGLVFGAAAAFVLEQLDESITSPHDLEARLGVPLLGNVPKLAADTDPLHELEDRRSSFVEAYNSVQTSLRFSTSRGAPRGILVTSARAAEGKTTTSVAIARNFALLGHSVALIDADMRNPSIHRLLDLSNARGLSNALSGTENIDGLLHAELDSRLSVMTAGPLPPNPAELLAGARFAEILKYLGERFEYVVVDGPPVLGLADAPLIASYVEATVFVVSASGTRTKAARIAINRLAGARAHLIGAILTKFVAKHAGYDYGYSYDYGSRDSTKKLTDES